VVGRNTSWKSIAGWTGPARAHGAQPSPNALLTRRHLGSQVHLPDGASPSFAAFTKYSHSQNQLYRLTVRPIDFSRAEVTALGAALPACGLQRGGPFVAALSIQLEPGLYCGNNSQTKTYSAKLTRGRTPICHHLIPAPQIRPPQRGC